LEQPVAQHGPRPAEPLFRGLEDEMHRTAEIARFGEIARGAKQHSRVAVVTAAMEPVRDRRAPGKAGLFVHGQRIHVGAQTDGAVALAFPFQDADNTRHANAAMHFDAPCAELIGHDGRRAHLFESDLGVGVEIAPEGGEFAGVTLDA
jgi:hypothetical protein